MDYIRISHAFKNRGNEFNFPQDLHDFLDKKINVFVTVELAPNCYEWSAVESKILELQLGFNQLYQYH
jgi:hypothetical protein